MAGSLMFLIHVMATKRNYPKTPKPTLKEIVIAVERSFLPVITPIIIVGGIVTGVFAVTEAAAVACLYAFILGFFVYKEIILKDLPGLLLSTMRTTAQIMFIVGTIACISWILIEQKFTEMAGTFIFSITKEPWIILFLFNILVLLLGALIEGAALLLLIVPIFMPLMQEIGVDPIHFGIFLTINILIGGITPPIGMALFVISGIAKVKVERLFTAIMPFLIPLIFVLLLVTYISPLSLAIPNWLMGAQ
jgi:C4-dicarboxylate transporter DctM subunit